MNGTLAFGAGTLGITGAGGLSIGNGTVLGNTPVLGLNQRLNVSNVLTIQPGAILSFDDGGQLSTGSTSNQGTLLMRSSAAQITGGIITNSGIIRGDGVIAAPVTNASAGEIRGEYGKTLVLQGTAGSNAGRVNLQGGTIQFASTLTNASSGTIIGRGTLMTGGTGLNNLGSVALSSGITDVFGDVVNNTGNGTKGVQISGNANVTFWDDVTNSSGLFRVSTGSSATFFGTYNGGSLTGTGNVYFEGDVTPGFSPANVTFQTNTYFGQGAKLVMELGGMTLGTQYDHLNFQGITGLAGTLDVRLINSFTLQAGNSFDLFDGTLTGMFDTLSLPVLGGGLIWNTSNLYTTGTILVAAPGPNSWQGAANALWSATGSWTNALVPTMNTDTALFANAAGAGSPVVLDSNQTINTLSFDSTSNFTIQPLAAQVLSLAGTTPSLNTAATNTGTQTVTVGLNLGNNTVVSVQGGTLALNSPANAVLGSNVTVTIASGATLNLGGAGNALSNGSSTHANVTNSGTLVATTPGKRVGTIDGTGTTVVTASGATLTANHIRQSGLTVGDGNMVKVAANGGVSGTSVVTNLSLNATGKLDLTNNDLIVNNGNLATLAAQLKSGLDINGTYGNGPGITSSAFASNPNFNTVLGIAANVELGYTSFSGQTVDANDVLIKYTYYGDADLNGLVDTATDFDLYITGLTSGGSLGGWLYGDFDYNGSVDSATDFDLYITGLTSQGGPLLTASDDSNLVQAVPEPSTLILSGLALLGFAGVKLRKRRLT